MGRGVTMDWRMAMDWRVAVDRRMNTSWRVVVMDWGVMVMNRGMVDVCY